MSYSPRLFLLFGRRLAYGHGKALARYCPRFRPVPPLNLFSTLPQAYSPVRRITQTPIPLLGNRRSSAHIAGCQGPRHVNTFKRHETKGIRQRRMGICLPKARPLPGGPPRKHVFCLPRHCGEWPSAPQVHEERVGSHSQGEQPHNMGLSAFPLVPYHFVMVTGNSRITSRRAPGEATAAPTCATTSPAA